MAIVDFKNIKNEWHVVAASEAVTEKPMRVVLFSKPLVIYRSNKEVFAFEDRCPHRNYPLSQSKLSKDGLECSYHGWRFNNEGQILDVPGLPKNKSLPKCSLQKISCKDYDGLIWLSLNKTEATRPPNDLVGQNRPLDAFCMSSSMKAEYLSAFENLLDGFHTPYVHSGIVRGNKKNRVKADMKTTQNKVEILYSGEESQSGLLSKVFEPSRQKSIGRFVFPSVAHLEYWGKEMHFMLEVFAAPVSTKEINFTLRISTKKGFAPKWIKHLILKPFVKKIMKQDQDVLEIQNQNIESFKGSQFYNAPTDFIVSEIIKLTKRSVSETQEQNWEFEL